MKAQLDTLREISDLTEVWEHEAHDFTPWLAKEENLNLLGEAIGVNLTFLKQESSVGDFRIDILAEEAESGRKVVIENQLYDSDHDHLGKLITYAAGEDASAIVWVVRTARAEHRAAIEWLNRYMSSDIGFFLCEVKLYQIGDSAKAVKFEVVESPNDWSRVALSEPTMSDSKRFLFEYWEGLNNFAVKREKFAKDFHPRKPRAESWLSYFVNDGSYHYDLEIAPTKGILRVSLRINSDKAMYNYLYARADDIESEAGLDLIWNEMEGKKGCSIYIENKADLSDLADRPRQFAWLIDTMVTMKPVFAKHIAWYKTADDVDESLFDETK